MRAAVLAALLLTGCGGAEPREGALSADEERQLNDAAAMLDEPVEDEAETDADERSGEQADQT